MRTLLANATVITMNPARDVLDTDILIENGVIADMGLSLIHILVLIITASLVGPFLLHADPFDVAGAPRCV